MQFLFLEMLPVSFFLDYYHAFVKGSNDVVFGCVPDIDSIRPFLVTNTVGWDLDVPDVVRGVHRMKVHEFSQQIGRVWQEYHPGNCQPGD